MYSIEYLIRKPFRSLVIASLSLAPAISYAKYPIFSNFFCIGIIITCFKLQFIFIVELVVSLSLPYVFLPSVKNGRICLKSSCIKINYVGWKWAKSSQVLLDLSLTSVGWVKYVRGLSLTHYLFLGLTRLI